MPNIKEIALKIWPEVSKSSTVGESIAVNFAEALIAELAKGNEPYCYQFRDDPEFMAYPGTGFSYEYPTKALDITPLYTLPPTASQIEQETAEAWISVNERLPELRDEVLVYCGYFTLGYRSDDIHDPECHQGWVIDFDNGNAHGITHWQPLPTPPKRSMEGV